MKIKNIILVVMVIFSGAYVWLDASVGDINRQLFEAIKNKKIEQVRYVLSAGADVNAVDNNLDTPLLKAVGFNNIEMVKLLLEKGAIVNVANQYGQTALYKAIMAENFEIIKLLIQADKNCLMIPFTQDNVLLDEDMPFSIQDSPLSIAINKKNIELLQLLLQEGAQVNIADNEGKTVLMYAAQYGDIDILNILLEAQADILAVDHEGQSAIDYASNQSIRDFLQKHRSLSFVAINKTFDQPPNPEEYTREEYSLSDSQNANELLEKQAAAFEQDLIDYWRNKLQIAYNDFLKNNSIVLRNLFVQDIRKQNIDILLIIVNAFRSVQDFIWVAEFLKKGATLEEVQILDKIIDVVQDWSAQRN